MSTVVVPFQPNQNAIDAAIASANDAFDDSDADVAGYIADTLDMGMTAGMNPLTLANYLSFLVGPQRAENIARTEMLGGYRDAALNMYRDNSDVVGGWMWSAAAGACVACSEEDGTIHDLDEDMDGMTHNSCRCSPIPITNPWSDILGPLGIDVSDIEETSILDDYVPLSETFWQRSFEEQAAILGSKSAAEAVSRGILEPADFVGHIEGGKYDGALYTKSLREALADAKGMSKAEIADLKSDLLAAVKSGDVEAARKASEVPLTQAEHLAEVHAQQARMVEEWAKLRNMTPEQYQAAVSEHLHDLLQDADLSVRRSPQALDDILSSGRFKTVFETDRSAASAAGDLEQYKGMRAQYETAVFGEGKHPVYAYLTDAGRDASSAEGFGSARIFLKDDVRDRTTFTFGDSLAAPVEPRPLNDPKYDAFAYVDRPEMRFGVKIPADKWAERFDPLNVKSLEQFEDKTPLGYVEAQIHGPLRSSDIARVVFDEAPPQALQDALDQAGITWAVRGEAEEAAQTGAEKALDMTVNPDVKFISRADVEAWTAKNADGVPSIGYHYTSQSGADKLLADGVDVSRATVANFGGGFYMFESPVADSGFGSEVVELAVHMENPLVTDIAGWEQVRDGILADFPKREALERSDWNSREGRALSKEFKEFFRQSLVKQGYDGLIVEDVRGISSAELDREIIAIKPGTVRVINDEMAAAEATATRAAQTDAEKALATAQSKVASLVQAGAPYDDIRAAKWEAAQAQAAVDAEQGGRGAAIFIENPRTDPLNSAQFEQTMDNLFGRQLTRDELGGLVGAPEGSFVDVFPSGQSVGIILRGPAWNPADPLNPDVRLEYNATRTIGRNPVGTVYAQNVSLMVDPALQGQGLGATILADQVDTLSQLGVSYIETTAGGSAAANAFEMASANFDPRQIATGYFVWPRMGYVGPLTGDALNAIGAAVASGDVPAEWANFTTIQQVMDAPGGYTWWKENGVTLDGLWFDLEDGSLSRQRLEQYLTERGLR